MKNATQKYYSNINQFQCGLSLLLASLAPAIALENSLLAEDDFENGLVQWAFDQTEQIEIVAEDGSDNHVLQLTPKRREFVHALLVSKIEWENIRFEGRFQFPIEGHGYLGFIYNYQASNQRSDFGCIYVKSNGNYVRVSPHYDGNPSWRLYEEMKVSLTGERRIEITSWNKFRIDVQGTRAQLFINNMDEAVVSFDYAPNRRGAIGLEARPGGGALVWVDDLVVSQLPKLDVAPVSKSNNQLKWDVYDSVGAANGDSHELPELSSALWHPLAPDPRGALITGLITQYRSGNSDVTYLRTSIDVAKGEVGPVWLAVSSANRLDVWFRGHYRGSIGEESYIWADYRESTEHPGSRLSLLAKDGANELIIRVHGRRFAGGGMYIDAISPQDQHREYEKGSLFEN